MLLEKDKMLSNKSISDQKHFGSITDLLNLFNWLEDTSMSSGNDTINSIIKKCAFHQSIRVIKNKFEIKNESSFNHVTSETIKRVINRCV